MNAGSSPIAAPWAADAHLLELWDPEPWQQYPETAVKKSTAQERRSTKRQLSPRPKKAGTTSATTRALVLERDGRRCVVADCDRTDLTVDHVIPRSRGGTNRMDNLQAMCKPHNALKADRTMAEFEALLWEWQRRAAAKARWAAAKPR